MLLPIFQIFGITKLIKVAFTSSYLRKVPSREREGEREREREREKERERERERESPNGFSNLAKFNKGTKTFLRESTNFQTVFLSLNSTEDLERLSVLEFNLKSLEVSKFWS